MRNWQLSIGLATALFAGGFLAGIAFRTTNVASAQDAAAEDDDPCAGFYPTKTMTHFIINRITEDMAEKYHLNDVQLENTRALIHEKIPAFMDKNRNEIRTLTNFWFESMVSDNPPDPEQVADWSKRIMPLVADFTGIVQDTSNEMRTYLNDEQTAKLDAELGAFNMGLTFVNQRLGTWADGGYDWETEWPRGPQFRTEELRRQQRVEAAMREVRAGREVDIEPGDGPQVQILGTPVRAEDGREGTSESSDTKKPTDATAKVEPPKAGKVVDEWVVYVEQFEKRYALNEDQKQKARQILGTFIEKRDQYLVKHKDKIDAAYSKMRDAKGEEAQKKAARDYLNVNSPIDRMFVQLKDRLGTLPTKAQRSAAAQKAKEEEAKASKSVSKKTDGEEPAKPDVKSDGGPEHGELSAEGPK